MESQNSTRLGEEMTDVEDNARLCKEERIYGGVFERDKLQVFAKDVSGTLGDFYLS